LIGFCYLTTLIQYQKLCSVELSGCVGKVSWIILSSVVGEHGYRYQQSSGIKTSQLISRTSDSGTSLRITNDRSILVFNGRSTNYSLVCVTIYIINLHCLKIVLQKSNPKQFN